MDLFLLDVVDATVPAQTNWPLILVLALTILVEALIMFLLKYNNFKKASLDSLLVNAASLGAGYLLISIAPGLFNSYAIGVLLKLLVITIAVELGVLYLLNRKHPFLQTLKVTVLMNAATYVLFYLFTRFFAE